MNTKNPAMLSSFSSILHLAGAQGAIPLLRKLTCLLYLSQVKGCWLHLFCMHLYLIGHYQPDAYVVFHEIGIYPCDP